MSKKCCGFRGRDCKVGYGVAQSSAKIYVICDVPVTLRVVPTLICNKNKLTLWDATTAHRLTEDDIKSLYVYSNTSLNKIQISLELNTNKLVTNRFYHLIADDIFIFDSEIF